MKTLLLSTAILLSMTAQTMAAGTHAGGHGEMAVGLPGAAGHVDRTVEVTMSETDDGDMIFEPRTFDIRQGETVRFAISNVGEQEHEFVLDTVEKNAEHKALMEKFPEMEHDDPNAIRLESGAKGEIVWTFSNKGSFEFACLMPGHYEAGMHGPVNVN